VQATAQLLNREETGMKRIAVGFIALFALAATWAPAAEETAVPAADVTATASGEAAAKAAPKSFTQKISYTVGVQIARSLDMIKKDIEVDWVMRGLRDAIEDKPLAISKEEMAEVHGEFMKKMHATKMAEQKEAAAENLKEAQAFLKKNAKKEGVIETKSGLQYEVMTKGDGPKPKASDRVSVHYRGTLPDGSEFDSSYKRGQPAAFPVQGVIDGWTEALQLMPVGSKYRLYIPPDLAYGIQGKPPIEPNQMLIFEVELLDIE
jgi:FKBP-type peptidyl-prolyl cis-trans isomerase